MKKAIFYIIGFIIIVFILPVIFTTSPKSQETIAQEENQKQDTEEKNIKTEDMNPYYLKYQKIKLLHTESGEIEELERQPCRCRYHDDTGNDADMPAFSCRLLCLFLISGGFLCHC